MEKCDIVVSGCVSLKSSWERERNSEIGETQTELVSVVEDGSQSLDQHSIEIEANIVDVEKGKLEDADWKEVSIFLNNHEPAILEAISENIETAAAFDRYEGIVGGESDASVTVVYSLKNKSTICDAVLAVDWNCSGTTVAAGYGMGMHEDWCAHKGSVCTWNVDRRQINPAVADINIDVEACISALKFHPVFPALLAVGTYSGQVIVCNLANSTDGNYVMAECKMGQISHRDAVNCLSWGIFTSSQQDHQLVTAGQDGRVIVWALPTRSNQLQLVNAFAISISCLPRSLRGKVVNTEKEAGIVAVAFSAKEKSLFAAVGETGAVFHCNINAIDPVGKLADCTMHNPVVLGLQPHNGTVYSVDACPTHRNLFLTASGDGSIRIYHILKLDPVLSVHLNLGYLYAAQWMPTRSTVFAVGTASGHLAIFDLMVTETKPTLLITVNEKEESVHSIAFNSKKFDMIACGDSRGVVTVIRLGHNFFTSSGNEQEKMNRVSTGTNVTSYDVVLL